MSSSDKIINSGIDGSGDGGGSFIASVSDYSDSLSPLEILINYELLINTMILFHIIIICFILLKNYNIKIISNGGVSLISKITNKYKLNKLQFIIDKLSNMSKNYLLLLLIINVLILLFYIFLNIYILNELSNNLNEYIYAYNKINKGVVLLLASPSARGARVAWGGGGVMVNNKVKIGSCFYYSSNAKDIFNLNTLRNNLPKISDVFINKDIFDQYLH